MHDAVRPGPAKVVGDEWRIDEVGERADAIEIALVERGVAEEVQPDAVKDDRVPRTDPIELLPCGRALVEEVLADDLEVVDLRPVLEEMAVMRDSEAEPRRISPELLQSVPASCGPAPKISIVFGNAVRVFRCSATRLTSAREYLRK